MNTLKNINIQRAEWRDQYVCTYEGRVVQSGDIITDFRGDTAIFCGLSRPPIPGKCAKVSTNRGEFYDRVFGLETIEV